MSLPGSNRADSQTPWDFPLLFAPTFGTFPLEFSPRTNRRKPFDVLRVWRRAKKRRRALARSAFSVHQWDQWLFLNTLDSLSSVKKLIAFYINEYNAKLPHSAFRGQTPDEMYFGAGDGIADDLESKRVTAGSLRLKSNRNTSCKTCESLTELSS